MNLSEVVDTITVDGKGARLCIDKSWLQGRTVFGGVVAMVGHAALRTQVPAELPLRTLQMAFVGPTGEKEIRAEARVLRQGKSVTHVQAEVKTEEGEVCATLHGCFGAGRSSCVERPGEPAPIWPRPEELMELPFMEGLAPSFTQHLRYCWARGPYPYEGKTEGCYGGWISCHGPSKVATESHLLALMDAWPSPALSMLKTPSPASTLSWNLEFLHPVSYGSTGAWWAFESAVETASQGYVAEEARLWNPDGELVAVSRQSVVVFG
ncbi:MAG: thioesterase family protein [Desulfobacterales bacterium]|nr:thioesterase family protein [Desulfobacterales bacterium]